MKLQKQVTFSRRSEKKNGAKPKITVYVNFVLRIEEFLAMVLSGNILSKRRNFLSQLLPEKLFLTISSAHKISADRKPVV